MKALEIAKKLSVVLCLLLALTMVFTACGGDPTDTPSDGSQVVDNNDNNQQDDNQQDDNQQGDNKQDNNKTPVGAKFETDYLAAAKKQFGGSTLHVLMWRQYTATEKALVDSFQAKTGVKVRTTVTTEGEYATKLAALISGKLIVSS